MMRNEIMLHTITLREMFLTFNVNLLKMKSPQIRKLYKCRDARNLAIDIFKVTLEMVIDDIIENGIQFQFPKSAKGTSYLCMQRITGQRYSILRKRGAFKDFDPLETNFNAYRIEYCAERESGKTFFTPLHLDKRRNARIAQLAKENKLKIGKIKIYQDYYPEVIKKYSAVPLSAIYRILRFGFTAFKTYITYGADVLTSSRTFRLQTGKLYRNQQLMLKHVLEKAKIKIRIMYRRLHILWDGYTYFSLTQEKFDKIKNDLEENKVIDFGTVILHKCYDEAVMYAYKRAALFKVKAGDEKRRFLNKEHLITDKAQLIELFHDWNWDTISLKHRTYMTLIPYGISVQQIYEDNRQPYIDWLRAKRWKELRR